MGCWQLRPKAQTCKHALSHSSRAGKMRGYSDASKTEGIEGVLGCDRVQPNSCINIQSVSLTLQSVPSSSVRTSHPYTFFRLASLSDTKYLSYIRTSHFVGIGLRNTHNKNSQHRYHSLVPSKFPLLSHVLFQVSGPRENVLTPVAVRSCHRNVLLRPIQDGVRLLQMGPFSTALHTRIPNR